MGGVSSLNWEIVSASEDDADIEAAEFLRFVFDQIEDFDVALADMLSALRTGFSVTEILWVEDVWNGKDVIVPRRFLSRDPDRFRFDTNLHLRLRTKDEPYQGVDVTDKYPLKFVVHTHQSRYRNPYGVSALRACWWPWWFKHHSFKYWVRAAEKGAVITPVLTYPEHWDEAQQKSLEETAKKFLFAGYIVKPFGTQVDFPQIKIDSSFADTLVQRTNSEMVYRIMGATHSTTMEGGGSRALAQVHDKRFQERIEQDAKSLANTIHRHVVEPTTRVNFAISGALPRWKLHYEPLADTKSVGESLMLAAKLGIPVSIEEASKLLQLPLANEGEQLIRLDQSSSESTNNGTNNDDNDDNDDNESDEDELDDLTDEASAESIMNKINSLWRRVRRPKQ